MSSKPNLFIIGAPKCGTTALSEYLKTHPEIFVPEIKEPHFFSTDFQKYRPVKELDEYLGLYKNRGADTRYFCDASVWYMYSSEALEKVREFNPDAKIIIMLRNPVQMVPSLHQQLLFTLDENVRDIEQAWRLQEDRKKGLNLPEGTREPPFLQYSEVADYAPQIRRVKQFFPEEQVLIILFDDFVSSTEKVYQQVMEFLELPPEPQKQFPVINERKTYRSKRLNRLVHRPPEILKKLTFFVKRIFGIREFNVLIKLGRLNREKVEKTPVSERFQRELKDSFREKMLDLQKEINRDLSSWL